MESYSHGAFTVTGIITSIPNLEDETPIIKEAWKKRMTGDTSATIIWQSHASMHAVYYNYNESRTSYDMLIWVMTEEDAIQTNDKLITLTIPAQDYRYVMVEWGFPDSIWQAWDTINQMTPQELPRTYGYDLEMYNEANTECSIAVSV